MKLLAILITNNVATYGGAQPLRQAVLFVFLPDGNGMRHKKVVNGNTTEYYYNGTQLLAEYRKGTDELLAYFYDQSGVAGLIYDSRFGGIRHYYFDKNTLGDIIAIRDEGGNVVAEYFYDAWGNILHEEGGMASVNPFRYRGYYYDVETGFYYLQTRYYDPTICRFINADNYELVAELSYVPGQLNMYAYCGNNPIMYTDETGEIVLTLAIAFAIGAVFSAGVSVALQLATTGNVNWGNVGISALFGGVSGLLAVTGVGGVVGQFLLQGTLSVGQTLTETAIYNTWNQLSIDGLVLDFVLSGVLGMIGAKGANREFRRIVQIEESLVHVLKRDFAKKGVKGLVKTWGAKSGKYVAQFIRPTLKDEFFANISSSLVNMIVSGW